MKKSKFTDEQIAFALKQAEVGTPVEEVCRKMGISDATFYNWRKKYGGLGPSELRRLKQLEEENSKLKRLVADLSLDLRTLSNSLAHWQAQYGALQASQVRPSKKRPRSASTRTSTRQRA